MLHFHRKRIVCHHLIKNSSKNYYYTYKLYKSDVVYLLLNSIKNFFTVNKFLTPLHGVLKL